MTDHDQELEVMEEDSFRVDSFKDVVAELKAARESKGLGLDQIASSTRINIGVLEKIESGNLEKHPGSVFIKGFLKSYAKQVGVDTPEFLERIRRIHLDREDPKADLSRIKKPIEEEESSRSKLIPILIVLVLIGAGGFWFFQFQGGKNPVRQPPIASPPTVVPTTLPPVVRDTEARKLGQQEAPTVPSRNEVVPEMSQDENLPEEMATELESTPEAPIANETEDLGLLDEEPTENAGVTTTQEHTGPDTTETATPVAAEAEAQDQNDPYDMAVMTLRAEATQNIWLDMAVDDEVPAEYLIHAGESIEWNAESQYRMTIGNTKAIRFTLNGAPLEVDQSRDLLVDLVISSENLDELNP